MYRPTLTDRTHLRRGMPGGPMVTLEDLLGPFATFWVRRGGDLRAGRPGDGPQARFRPRPDSGQGSTLRVRLDDPVASTRDWAVPVTATPRKEDHDTRIGVPHTKTTYRHTLTVAGHPWRSPLDGSRPVIPQGVKVARRGHRDTPRELSKKELAYINNYTPRVIPAEQWAHIRDWVISQTLEVTPHGNMPAEENLRQLARHTAYCIFTLDMDMDVEQILDVEVIAHVSKYGMTTYSTTTRSSARSRLLWIADVLAPTHKKVSRLERFGRNPARAPYTYDEVKMLRDWAASQNTVYFKHAAWCMLAFGFGAGIRARELMGLRKNDVVEDDHGVLVHIRSGDAPRVVPMIAEWEDYALVLADAVADGAYVFKSERDREDTGLVGFSTFRSKNKPACGVQFTRMRHTWLVSHLNAGVPYTSLMDAAGVKGFTAFDRLIPFLDDIKATDVREHYNTESRERKRAAREANRDYYQALAKEWHRNKRDLVSLRRKAGM